MTIRGGARGGLHAGGAVMDKNTRQGVDVLLTRIWLMKQSGRLTEDDFKVLTDVNTEKNLTSWVDALSFMTGGVPQRDQVQSTVKSFVSNLSRQETSVNILLNGVGVSQKQGPSRLLQAVVGKAAGGLSTKKEEQVSPRPYREDRPSGGEAGEARNLDLIRSRLNKKSNEELAGILSRSGLEIENRDLKKNDLIESIIAEIDKVDLENV